MRLSIPRRLVAPLIACGIAGMASVVGGACLSSTSPPPPALRTGNYVLTAPGVGTLPGIITDSAGRALRVIADTLALNVTDQTYEERGTVAITPAGGTEQPAAPFIITRRRYSMTAASTLVLPSTLFGGMITAFVTNSASVSLQMPNHTSWRYDYR
jgi:hypothetical protein